jgi:hypothetical protein
LPTVNVRSAELNPLRAVSNPKTGQFVAQAGQKRRSEEPG